MTDIKKLKHKIEHMDDDSVRCALKAIAIEWFINDAGNFQVDRELGADSIAAVSEILNEYGVRI